MFGFVRSVAADAHNVISRTIFSSASDTRHLAAAPISTSMPTTSSPGDIIAFKKAMTRTNVIAADFETTGLGAKSGHRVVQLGLCPVNLTTKEIGPAISLLINPERAIPKRLTEGPNKIHNISDAVVKNEPTFAARQSQIEDLVRGKVTVWHNAEFDEGFFKMELARTAKPTTLAALQTVVVCSKRIAQGLQPRAAEAAKLNTVAKAYNIEIGEREGNHDGKDDAVLLAKCILKMHPEYERAKKQWGVHIPDAGVLFDNETPATVSPQNSRPSTGANPGANKRKRPDGPSDPDFSPNTHGDAVSTKFKGTYFDETIGEHRLAFWKRKHENKPLSQIPLHDLQWMHDKLPHKLSGDSRIAVGRELLARSMHQKPAEPLEQAEVTDSSSIDQSRSTRAADRRRAATTARITGLRNTDLRPSRQLNASA